MDKEVMLEEIFNRLTCNFDYIKSHPEENLLSWRCGLVARDLLILYFEITNKLNICIPEEFVNAGKFSTYAEILQLVNS